MNNNTYKIVICGEPGCGKTTFVNRHLTGEYTKEYVPTLGVEVHPLRFHTNHGTILFNIWDCAGQEKFGGLRDGYYVKADGVIIMMDLSTQTNKQYKFTRWFEELQRHEVKNIIVCGNKCDLKTIKDEDIIKYGGYAIKHKLPYYTVSARSNYNFEKPFLELARKFLGDDTFFCEDPAIKPPEVLIDPILLEYEEQDENIETMDIEVLRETATSYIDEMTRDELLEFLKKRGE